MKKLSLLIVFTNLLSILNAQEKNGRIIDASTKEVLVGANVRLLDSYQATSTDANGTFRFNALKEADQLIVSFIGYRSDTISATTLASNPTIELYPILYKTDEVIISSTRVGLDAPATVTNVDKEMLVKNNLGQDIPYLLQQTPSVVSTSDAGAGIGYTGIRIRGSDASRINVTVNGIPINDAESHGVFWVNMPDLASSLNSVQIQRGIGTSTNGAAAFGATLNLETDGIQEKAYGEINNSIGSFNTRKHTVKVGSGLINDRFVFEGRLSQINSDGYIDRANADLQSYFLSGGFYGAKTIVKALVFGGQERTYQSWYGTPESRVSGNEAAMKMHASNEGYSMSRRNNLLTAGRTYNNYLYENQVDNYGQDHYQLHLSHEFSAKITANVALHYTKGEGYFEEFREEDDLTDYALDDVIVGNDTIRSSDLVRRRWLDNDFYGFTYALIYKANNKLNFNLGGGLNHYDGDHFGRVIWSEFASDGFLTDEYYFNLGTKTDGNVYLKSNYSLNDKINFLADLQVRSISYTVKGTDNDLRQLSVDEDFLFFNPKIGANAKINDHLQAYLFLGIGNREPNRADFIDQNPTTPPSDANKAERMRNLEAGVEFRKASYQLAANLYYMDYTNQLVQTGQLNDVGSPIRQNVDRSFRRGLELQLAYRPTKKVKLLTNATFSQNKILEFTNVLYDYTTGFDIIEQDLGTTDIALSPNVIVNGELSYTPFQRFEASILYRYIGEQYLDNTSNNGRKLDSYFVNDLRLSYKVPTKLVKSAYVRLLINNFADEDYSSNGYTYSYIVGETITENFLYPQAFRNYLLSLDVKF